MGGVAGGSLAAAVSNAGALGLVGGAYGEPDAQGALMGTRFYAATEALGHGNAKERIAAARGRDTQRTRVFDIVRRHAWPQPYTGRAIRNRFMEWWVGREDDLGETLDEETHRFRAAVTAGDLETAMVWAGEGVDLIFDVVLAGELVRRIGAESEACLRHASDLLQ
jgi:nitronate monooxygenase